MSIEDRLARLERENRRLKAAALLVLLAAASVFLMGQARPTRYEAESFIVRDARGVTVAALGTMYDAGSNVGRPILSFYEPDGSIQTYFGYLGGSELRLQLSSGASSVQIMAGRDGDARVRLTGNSETGAPSPQVNLRVLPGGDTGSVFVTDGSAVRAMMQHTQSGQPVFMLLDRDQNPTWVTP